MEIMVVRHLVENDQTIVGLVVKYENGAQRYEEVSLPGIKRDKSAIIEAWETLRDTMQEVPESLEGVRFDSQVLDAEVMAMKADKM